MNQAIKETLEKQINILSERSTRERGEILPDLTRAMIELTAFLEYENIIDTRKIFTGIRGNTHDD